eukprot:TRINITY_DN29207_c0_g1_i1.p1 TRINITY_DN29207_c0_g1~~TRINITY_DN29207_c0_g1_i1.p1  ORF type:complete len:178 (+),score=45.98 TRINITY_DN29207_c0_g1_i1:166-699(+)
MNMSSSLPALKGPAPPENVSELGDLFIKKGMFVAKDKMKLQRDKLESSMRHSRDNFYQRSMYSTWGGGPPMWQEPGSTGLRLGGKKYVGQQANELSQWMNAEGVTRMKEETNVGVPTVRQVLRVDDRIELEQMTKRSGGLPGDLEEQDHRMKRDPKALLRHMVSYRPGAPPGSGGGK